MPGSIDSDFGPAERSLRARIAAETLHARRDPRETRRASRRR